MNQIEKDQIFLKNYMEEVVFHMLDDLAKERDFCNCPKCYLDIAAYALNCLPPKYTVTRKGEIYSKLSHLQQQFDVDVTIALIKAIGVVKGNPQHSGFGI